MTNRCLIISGAPNCFFPSNFRNADFTIACDSGYLHAVKAGIVPDLLVSDFDSFDGILNPAMEIVRAVPEKDDTDTLLALKEAMHRGYSDIMIVGGLGGRIDHTLANISLTAFAAKNGAICHLIDEHHQIFAIKDDSIMVRKGYWRWLSVFAMDSEVRGVTLRGVKYPLKDAVLTNTYPIGVSNEFTESAAIVTAERGTLLVVLSDIE